MITIYKYTLKSDTEEILIYKDAEFLCIQTQNNEPQAWFKVDTSKPQVRYLYKIYGTGHEIDLNECGKYLGTFQINNGSLVFHVFSHRLES